MELCAVHPSNSSGLNTSAVIAKVGGYPVIHHDPPSKMSETPLCCLMNQHNQSMSCPALGGKGSERIQHFEIGHWISLTLGEILGDTLPEKNTSKGTESQVHPHTPPAL